MSHENITYLYVTRMGELTNECSGFNITFYPKYKLKADRHATADDHQ